MSAETPDESTSDPPGVPWWRSGLNFAAAVARYVAAGCPNVPLATYRERLQICRDCALCRRGKCLVCGCNVARKAKMATENCPKELWPKLET